MMPSAMGLSASVNGVALYWMQSIISPSQPVFFNAHLPLGDTRIMLPSLTARRPHDLEVRVE